MFSYRLQLENGSDAGDDEKVVAESSDFETMPSWVRSFGMSGRVRSTARN